MPDFDPIGQPRAVPLPTASDFAQLYQLILKIRDHLNQFTERWAISQPDCPRIATDKPGYILSVPIEQFLQRRQHAVASTYRCVLRDQVLRLWQPGMKPPPTEIAHPKNDIFDVLMPWVMENIQPIAPDAQNVKPDDDFRPSSWFEAYTQVTGDSLRQAKRKKKLSSRVIKGKTAYSKSDAERLWPTKMPSK